MLGHIEGFVSVGELRFLWERGLKENRLCGCGVPFSDCEFWDEVLTRAFGGRRNVDLDRVEEILARIDKKRAVPSLATGVYGRAFQRDLLEYSSLLSRLYRAVRDVTGAEVIVDSSKFPPYAYVLRLISEIDLKVINLVRDSRAVAYSWQRAKALPEVHWKHESMPTHGPFVAARGWGISCLLLQPFARSSSSGITVRYEDLVGDPELTIDEILRWFPDRRFSMSMLSQAKINHTVSGNPVRHQDGPLKVQPDVEWLRGLTHRDRWLVTAMTFPLLLRYGYRLDGAAGRDDTGLPVK